MEGQELFQNFTLCLIQRKEKEGKDFNGGGGGGEGIEIPLFDSVESEIK